MILVRMMKAEDKLTFIKKGKKIRVCFLSDMGHLEYDGEEWEFYLEYIEMLTEPVAFQIARKLRELNLESKAKKNLHNLVR